MSLKIFNKEYTIIRFSFLGCHLTGDFPQKAPAFKDGSTEECPALVTFPII